jgi:hypothetical protein
MLGRMAALLAHQHRFTQVPPDSPEEAAELVEPLLALDLSQVDVEVDLLSCNEPKIISMSAYGQTRSAGHSGPGARARTVAAVSNGTTVSPSEYSNRHPRATTRSSRSCQSFTEVCGTQASGSDPIRSGSNSSRTSSQTRSVATPSSCRTHRAGGVLICRE